MKKLSVIAMVAMTAFVSTSCMNFDEDGFPGDTKEEYGYIKLSASADNVMVTRGVENANVATWYAWVVDGDGSDQYGTEIEKKLIGEELEAHSFAAGTGYKIVVSNLKNDDWKEENNGYGAPYWLGSDANVEVKAGVNNVTIACGKAKNAMFYIDAEGFAGEKLEITVEDKADAEREELVFSKEDETIDTEAYFEGETELTFSITYTIGESVEKTIENKTLTLGEAGTKSKLSISSSDDGRIKLTITYEDFEETEGETIIIDSATGDEKQD